MELQNENRNIFKIKTLNEVTKLTFICGGIILFAIILWVSFTGNTFCIK